MPLSHKLVPQTTATARGPEESAINPRNRRRELPGFELGSVARPSRSCATRWPGKLGNIDDD